MSEPNLDGIAIIGVHGRFPGAGSVEALWANLVAGKEGISFFSDDELIAAGLDPAGLRKAGHYVPARGVMKDADHFDAAFFGIHPKEAEVMDPQQRVFLEVCWEALERAGYPADRAPGAVGVFAGATFNTYYLHALHPRADLRELVGREQVMLGNEKDYLTTRVAYKLNLRGPAISLNTACSSSLVAVCQACQSLLTYQCSMALAGGVSVRVPQIDGYFHQEENIASPDGHTRTFDIDAKGTIFSNGVTLVVLKRLDEAVADGDEIYGVIKGSALNNDGSQRVSFGAPSVEGQSEVVSLAQEIAGVEPDTISYIEAHGTATPIGDPIEVAALTKAFRRSTERRQFCAIGSIKTNLGHLDAAAGTAGLIKVALALKHGLLPPSLHFLRANPQLELETSPFFVNSTLRPWKTEGATPRRAGVSSFGTGGTNAHVVVEEAPAIAAPSAASRSQQLLVLSAKTPAALEAMTLNLATHLEENTQLSLPDVAYTLQAGRSEFNHRRSIICQNATEAIALLRQPDSKKVFTARQEQKDPPIVFMFPGQGAQYVNMGAALHETEPVFREHVARCCAILQPILGVDLRTILFAPTDKEKGIEEQLRQTRFTQPAIFTIEYSLAQLLMSWGIKPSAMIGHSVGEYVAGCLSAVFTLEDALTLVARRAALVQAMPPGAMLAVRLPEQEITPFLSAGISIAAVNSPNLCVVAGSHEATDIFEKALSEKKIASKRLHTSHAFHSAMMDPVVAPFTDLLRQYPRSAPTIPFVSNVTGQWITDAEVKSDDYWARHVRQTVRFAEGVATLAANPRQILLEVGPGQTLSQLARQHPSRKSEQLVLPTLGGAHEEEMLSLVSAVGRLWLAGAHIDWKEFQQSPRRRVVLPTYPFERKRFWPESLLSPETAPGTQPIFRPINSTAIAASTSQTPAMALSHSVSSPIATGPNPARKGRLLQEARALLQDLSGVSFAGISPETHFLEVGLDSLLLTQAALLFKQKFGVGISFRQLMGDVSSLEAVASLLDKSMPAEVLTPSTGAVQTAASGTVASGFAGGSSLEQLLVQQLQLTNQILAEVQRGAPRTMPNVSSVPTIPTQPGPGNEPTPSAAPAAFGPFRAIEARVASGELTDAQQLFLSGLIKRYTDRTKNSKRLTQESRKFLADPRTVAGFRPFWKEMVYPLVMERSLGSRMWDADKNEYIDFSMGFGTNLLGHSPREIIPAIEEQLHQGIEVGPQTPLAGQVAQLMCELTGMERCAFANTGSEAVLATVRVARTVTGRKRIVYFTGDYHGVFDEVLQRVAGSGPTAKLFPIAPGVTHQDADQLTILEFDRPESLATIRALGSEIAAVLVEPIQSRRPDHQPREFLHALRQLTTEIGSALIFDEVITGFRSHPGGIQALYGIQADLASYGKIVGGGMPIGAVCGSARFMDALDGGFWQYGDESVPEVGVTFFAGTYIRHPLAMAGAWALLSHLKREGPALQNNLAIRMTAIVQQINGFLRERSAPVHLEHFSSFFWIRFEPGVKYGSLIFFLLRDKGIHIFEGRLFFLSTAHSTEDESRLVEAFKESIAEMQHAGFLSGRNDPKTSTPSETLELKPDGLPAKTSRQIPLTENQRGLWLLSKLSPSGSRAYTEYFSLDVKGSLDERILTQSLQTLVDRHEGLRAVIDAEGEAQTILPAAPLDLVVVDLSTTTPAARSARLAEEFAKIELTQFNFTQAPTLHAWKLRLDAQHHILVLMLHHVFGNGPSNAVIIDELWNVYGLLAEGRTPVLEPAMQLSEYVSRIAKQNSSPAFESDRKFWLEQFSGTLPVLDLPTDRARPPALSYLGARHSITLDQHLTAALRKVSGKLRSSVFVTLCSAFNVLLHRLTGQNDLVIGVPFEGEVRQLPGGSHLVANTTNMIPLRSRLSGDESFAQFAAATKSLVLEANEHQAYFFGNLIHDLKLKHDPSRSPVVAVSFNVERGPAPTQVGSLKTSFLLADVPCANPRGTSKFELAVNIVDLGEELRIDCDYQTDLFRAETIQRWFGHFQVLLAAIATDASRSISELPLLTEAERNLVVHEFNVPKEAARSRSIPLDGGATLHKLFENQAARSPRSIAISCNGVSLTYERVNAHANRLARELVHLGVKPDSIVGLCLDRTNELVIGILAILKAGGSYLPIDLSYPAERLAFMLEDAKAPVLLTQRELLANLPTTSAKILCLDGWFETPAKAGDESNLASGTGPDHLAYVIYTSGTTGKPKGSLITHRNAARLFSSTEHWFDFDEKDVWTLFHSAAFDFSVWEIWGALLYGGKLVVVPFMVSRSPDAFYDLLAEEKVTVLNQTPSAFRQLIQTDAVSKKELALRYIIFGGEALEMQSLRPWFDRHGDQKPKLVNMYGITETTVHVTYRPLSKNDLESGSVIGVPIPDLQVYILDPKGQPVPIGLPGEMYVGGAGLARGYFNRPDLTAGRFIPDHLTGRTGARLYRTGDLARFLPSREIEYLGRIDHQVKVRGFRIELGEIESVLCQHPSVREAVVIAREDVPGDKRLVAYFVARETGPESNVLRDHLKKKLPEYMVPAVFIPLQSLPLTTNGKVDRKALPEPGQQRPELAAVYVAPRTEQETMLAEIWSQVLQVKRVGIHDNFFELGGHSLLALRVVSRIRQQFGFEVPISIVFETPNIAELAIKLADLQIAGMDQDELARLLEDIESDPGKNP